MLSFDLVHGGHRASLYHAPLVAQHPRSPLGLAGRTLALTHRIGFGAFPLGNAPDQSTSAT